MKNDKIGLIFKGLTTDIGHVVSFKMYLIFWKMRDAPNLMRHVQKKNRHENLTKLCAQKKQCPVWVGEWKQLPFKKNVLATKKTMCIFH